MTIAPAVATALGTVKIAIAAIGGPVTIVIAVITALVLKFIHAYNTSEEFRNKVGLAFYNVKKAVTESLAAAMAKVKEFVSVGKNVIVGLWNGINDKVAWLKGKVKGVVDKIKGWFISKEGFDEHSPSKWSEGVGSYVMDGLGNGFEKDETKQGRKTENPFWTKLPKSKRTGTKNSLKRRSRQSRKSCRSA